MNTQHILIPDPTAIILSTGLGVLAASLLIGFFVKLRSRADWESTGRLRKRALVFSLVIYSIFLIAYLPLILIKIRDGDSLMYITGFLVLFNVCAAIVIVELLRALLPSGKVWTSRKHFVYVVTSWAVLSLLTTFAGLFHSGEL